MSFYEGLFGWTYRRMDPSPLSDYVMIEAGGQLIGGLRRMPPDVKRPVPLDHSPLLYFTVDHLAAKVSRAQELGASLVGSSVDLGAGRGHYQWIRDREGHLIGLWALD
jgi:predicted enzyme related to lactoylglutathione lyase